MFLCYCFALVLAILVMTPDLYAQAPAVTASPAPGTFVAVANAVAGDEVKAPTVLDGVLEKLEAAGGLIAGLLILLEIALRALPTKKALSVLVPVQYFVDKIAALLLWLSKAILKPLIEAANRTKKDA